MDVINEINSKNTIDSIRIKDINTNNTNISTNNNTTTNNIYEKNNNISYINYSNLDKEIECKTCEYIYKSDDDVLSYKYDIQKDIVNSNKKESSSLSLLIDNDTKNINTVSNIQEIHTSIDEINMKNLSNDKLKNKVYDKNFYPIIHLNNNIIDNFNNIKDLTTPTTPISMIYNIDYMISPSNNIILNINKNEIIENTAKNTIYTKNTKNVIKKPISDKLYINDMIQESAISLCNTTIQCKSPLQITEESTSFQIYKNDFISPYSRLQLMNDIPLLSKPINIEENDNLYINMKVPMDISPSTNKTNTATTTIDSINILQKKPEYKKCIHFMVDNTKEPIVFTNAIDTAVDDKLSVIENDKIISPIINHINDTYNIIDTKITKPNAINNTISSKELKNFISGIYKLEIEDDHMEITKEQLNINNDIKNINITIKNELQKIKDISNDFIYSICVMKKNDYKKYLQEGYKDILTQPTLNVLQDDIYNNLFKKEKIYNNTDKIQNTIVSKYPYILCGIKGEPLSIILIKYIFKEKNIQYIEENIIVSILQGQEYDILKYEIPSIQILYTRYNTLRTLILYHILALCNHFGVEINIPIFQSSDMQLDLIIFYFNIYNNSNNIISNTTTKTNSIHDTIKKSSKNLQYPASETDSSNSNIISNNRIPVVNSLPLILTQDSYDTILSSYNNHNDNLNILSNTIDKNISLSYNNTIDDISSTIPLSSTQRSDKTLDDGYNEIQDIAMYVLLFFLLIYLKKYMHIYYRKKKLSHRNEPPYIALSPRYKKTLQCNNKDTYSIISPILIRPKDYDKTSLFNPIVYIKDIISSSNEYNEIIEEKYDENYINKDFNIEIDNTINTNISSSLVESSYTKNVPVPETIVNESLNMNAHESNYSHQKIWNTIENQSYNTIVSFDQNVSKQQQQQQQSSYTAGYTQNNIDKNSNIEGPKIPHMYAKLRRSKRLGEPSITSLRRNSVAGKKTQDKVYQRKNTQQNLSIHNTTTNSSKTRNTNNTTHIQYKETQALDTEVDKQKKESKYITYLCNICGKDFDKSSGLKRHIKVCILYRTIYIYILYKKIYIYIFHRYIQMPDHISAIGKDATQHLRKKQT